MFISILPQIDSSHPQTAHHETIIWWSKCRQNYSDVSLFTWRV